MHDAVEIRRRIDRLLQRLSRRDDYGQLLARGDVVRLLEDVDDPSAWRAGIRAQARADRIKVRTGVGDGIVYALLVNASRRADEGDAYIAALEEIVIAAAAYRHEPTVVARDGSEVVVGCNRCPALAYANTDDHVLGGALVDDGCPNEDEPRTASLTVMFVGW